MKNPLILGIETSCDETAVAIFCGKQELSTVVSSQVKIHNQYGGIVPEIASRNHTMDIAGVVEKAVEQANIELKDIDYIAVTCGAGLSGALLVGLSFAKSLAYGLQIGLIGVNHIQAHIDANYIEQHDLTPPFLAIVVSGGHTSIVRVDDYNQYEVVAQTLDDACGEAFDKVARVLGLGYPGGAVIEKFAKRGIPNLSFFKEETYTKKQDFISYSGLKTAAINFWHNYKQKNSINNDSVDENFINNFCASFLHNAIDMIIKPSLYYAKQFGYRTVVLAGGVAANQVLRQKLSTELATIKAKLCVPSIKYCTDNASMICIRAYHTITYDKTYKNNNSWFAMNANSGLKINENIN